MKKTMLVISIMTAIVSINTHAISNEDLLNFDDILNAKDSKKVEKVDEVEKIVKKKNISTKETVSIKEHKKEKITVKTDQDIVVEEEIAKNNDLVVEKENIPTLVVPVIGQSITLKIDLLKDKLVREKVASTEVVVSHLNEIDKRYKDEKEIIDFIDTVKPFSNYTMYETEKDTLTGIESNIIKGKLVKKEILSDIKKGFSYFVRIVEKDDRNERLKLRLDMNIIDVNSYNEVSAHLADGSYQKIKIPNIKESNSSNEFWIKLDSSKDVSYKIDDIHKVTIKVQREIPFVQQVFVTDHEKLAIIKEEKMKEEARLKALEEARIKEESKTEDEILIEELEDRLK